MKCHLGAGLSASISPSPCSFVVATNALRPAGAFSLWKVPSSDRWKLRDVPLRERLLHPYGCWLCQSGSHLGWIPYQLLCVLSPSWRFGLTAKCSHLSPTSGIQLSKVHVNLLMEGVDHVCRTSLVCYNENSPRPYVVYR